MREIKFRHFFPSTGVMTAGVHPHTLILTSTGKEDFWKDAVWMQYTGRTDIGAGEIYEGDIVRGWVSRYPDSKTTGVVKYNDHAQAFQLRYENCFGGHANEFMHHYHFFERIGNIYEHSNLLKS